MDDQITAQQALAAVNDPATPGATLHVIAAQYPDLWPQIAAHPSAYPDLLAWLSNVGGPEVQSIVASRTGAPMPMPLAAPIPSIDIPTMVMPPAAIPAPQPMPDVWQGLTQPAPQIAWQPDYAQPAPRSGTSKPMVALIIVLAVALLAGIGFLVYLMLGKDGTSTTDSQSAPPSTSQTPGPATHGTTGPAPAPPGSVVTVTQTKTQTVAPTTQQPPDPESVAYQNLINQANADLPQAQVSVQDQWTNMLATKKVGTLPDGSTWTYQSIWSLYQSIKQQYPTALLIQGSTYTSTNLGPEWFNVASGITFSNPDDALNWCSTQGYSDNDCFAFRFTNADGTNAKHNG